MFTTQHTTQIITPFGSGYVPEQHRELSAGNLGPSQLSDVVAALRESMFAELLGSLRAALSLRDTPEGPRRTSQA